MATVHMHLDSSVPAERVRASLIDFSEDRPQRWPGITPSLYKVYSVGETIADVQEGTKAPGATAWARELYDWSDAQTVTWTVQESNFCAPGSYVSATIKPAEGGGSHIDITWSRTPTSFGGRIATLLIRMTKGKPVTRSFQQGLDRI